MISWKDAVEEFLYTKMAEGRADRTLRDYRRALEGFFSRYGPRWPDGLRGAVLEHFAGLSDKAPATYNIQFRNLRAFFRFCLAEGYLKENPLRGLKQRKEPFVPRAVDEKTIEKLLELPDRKTYTGLRDYALILLQLDTGIRPSEALALRMEHLNLSLGQAVVDRKTAKTREMRTVVFSPHVVRAIRKLLAARPPEWDESVPVFASANDGRQLTRDAWTHRLKKYSKKLGTRVTPYMLRHTAAIMALRRGANLFAVQVQLGHRVLEMTRRYTYLTDEDIRREHAKASPVAHILGGPGVKKRVRLIEKKGP